MLFKVLIGYCLILYLYILYRFLKKKYYIKQGYKYYDINCTMIYIIIIYFWISIILIMVFVVLRLFEINTVSNNILLIGAINAMAPVLFNYETQIAVNKEKVFIKYRSYHLEDIKLKQVGKKYFVSTSNKDLRITRFQYKRLRLLFINY